MTDGAHSWMPDFASIRRELLAVDARSPAEWLERSFDRAVVLSRWEGVQDEPQRAHEQIALGG